MKKFFKLLKITSAGMIVFAIILISASYFLQDKIAGVLIRFLNSKITTRLETGSSRLSLISRFPRASLELKNVLIHSSDNFNHAGFPGTPTDTLLAASSVSVEFSILDIIRRHYNIDRIGIKSGKIYLLSDSSGGVNYEVTSGNKEGSGSEFELNLEAISLTDMAAVYNNLSTKLLIRALIEKGRLKSRISPGRVDFSANSSLHIGYFQLNHTKISRGFDAGLDVVLYSSGDTTSFRKGTLRIDDLVFALEGNIRHGNILDLSLTGQQIDIRKTMELLPDNISASLASYDPSGKLRLTAEINGRATRTLNPHIEITALLEEGHIRYGRSPVAINNLSFSGFFSNGKRNLPETSSLSLENVVLKLGSSWINGSFKMVRLNDPEALVTVRGTIKPEELRDFFGLQSVAKAGGAVDADLEMKGDVFPGLDYSFNDLLSFTTRANLDFKNFSLAISNSEFDVSGATGNIKISDIITTDKLSLTYKDHLIKVTGSFEHFPGWLSGKNSLPLSGSADVAMNRMDPVRLFGINTGKTGVSGSEAIKIPSGFNLNLNFEIDTFRYKTFTGRNVKGILDYHKTEMNFRKLSFNSLEGYVTGSGIFYQNTDNTVIVKGRFDIEGIDIKKAFVSFRNFGQEFIKAENLAGTLSGSLSLLLPMNSSLNPEIRFLTAEGKYTITNGSLMNFEPVKKLSSYIELSELENITFEKLGNDFYIRNNFFYVPQMNITSSAVTLSVNGMHSFDNDYTYHVKMLLSEVLSRKFRKSKTPNSEFGPVEDDGLGRTSLLLKVEGKGDVVKTGYDIKAAGSEIRSSMKAEKKTLKTIMKEEYGWFKKDTSVKVKDEIKEEKKPRFRVTWDDK